MYCLISGDVNSVFLFCLKKAILKRNPPSPTTMALFNKYVGYYQVVIVSDTVKPNYSFDVKSINIFISE